MITAIVLIKVESNRIPEVAQNIANLTGVSEVYSVTGEIDLIAIVRVPEYEGLEAVVSRAFNQTEGVLSTFTHLAFRAYSADDLGAAFSLGSDH